MMLCEKGVGFSFFVLYYVVSSVYGKPLLHRPPPSMIRTHMALSILFRLLIFGAGSAALLQPHGGRNGTRASRVHNNTGARCESHETAVFVTMRQTNNTVSSRSPDGVFWNGNSAFLVFYSTCRHVFLLGVLFVAVFCSLNITS